MIPIEMKNHVIKQFKNGPEHEQELVRLFFENRPDGFYVDVGANEPIIQSQTYHLEQLGWKGLLVEPIPGYCELLERSRSGTVIQCACSSPENEGKELQLSLAEGHSTLNDKPIARVESVNHDHIFDTCKTLDSILEENHVKQNFEFISIDIEGHEMEMFKGFSLRHWKPQLVLLEDHVLNHEKHRHMTQNGYSLIMRTGLNSWYVPAERNFKLSGTALVQYFRRVIGSKLAYRGFFRNILSRVL